MEAVITAVFDTNVILQGILSPDGPAAVCVSLAFNGDIQLITTNEILSEIEDVISRPRLTAKYPQLLGDRRIHIVEKMREFAAVVARPPSIYRLERDRSDEVFIDLALTYGVDYLLSRDRDILDLSRDYDFRSTYPGLTVVSPVGFLETFRKS